jgi:polygalacturonase
VSGLLDNLLGIREMFIGGVAVRTRNRLNLVGDVSAVDNLAEKRTDVTIALGGDATIRYAKSFGAVGDGEADDTAALQATINAVPSTGGIVDLGVGIFRIRKQANDFLTITQKSNITIRGEGAVIIAGNGEATSGNASMLYLDRCTNIRLVGIVLDGNRDARSPLTANSVASCLRIRGGAKILVDRAVIQNSCFDGIHVRGSNVADESTYPTDLVFRDVQVTNSFRNGVSLIGCNRVWFWGGRYSGSNGTLPAAGIDCEPNNNDTYGVKNVYIDGVRVDGNTGWGVMLAGADATHITQNVQVRGLSGNANGRGLITGSFCSNVDVDGVQVVDDSTAITEDAYILAASGSKNMNFRNVTFRNISVNAASKALLYVDNGNDGFTVDGFMAQDTSCSAMQILAPAVVRNVHLDNVAGDPYCAIVSGVGSLVENFFGIGCGAQALRVAKKYATARNIRLHNCGWATGTGKSAGDGPAMRFVGDSPTSTTSYSGVIENVTITRDTAQPGYPALYVDDAPLSICDVLAQAESSDWTNSGSTRAIRLPSVMTNTKRLRNLRPSPLTATATWNPGAIDPGSYLTLSVSLEYADVGDFVEVKHSISLAGLFAKKPIVESAGSVLVALEYPATVLIGSATFDPGNLADGAGETAPTITVTGAQLGDFAVASFSLDNEETFLPAAVIAADTVEVRLQNESGSSVDLNSGTLRVRVTRNQTAINLASHTVTVEVYK